MRLARTYSLLHLMYTLSDTTLDRWISETVPYVDLTSWTLGLNQQPGRITFTAREDSVVCGTEEVRRIFEKLGMSVSHALISGESVKPGTPLFEATGPVEALHRAWKVSINVLEHSSGIATRTHRFVTLAKSANKDVEVVATCKGCPGTRELTAKAVLAGGGSLHRLGISETIIVFDHHRAFLESFDSFIARIPEWKKKACEKKFVVEAESEEEALALAEAGVDCIQFDKVSPGDLARNVKILRKIQPRIILIAAGGINEQNIAAYAATGIDAIATSAVYFGKPADIGVTMLPVA